MRNTSRLTRAERKEKRRLRKAQWKGELLSYYYPVINISQGGIEYLTLGHR